MIPAQNGPPSAETPPPGRVLAIDYGRRRIGLALSDALGLTSQPLVTLERRNRRNDMRRLRQIVRHHEVRRIVVGHPVHLDGTAGEMAAEAAQFAARIGKELGLPVEMVDERLSSWEAEQHLAGARHAAMKKPGGRPKHAGEIDRVAAAVILRDYLERKRKRAKE